MPTASATLREASRASGEHRVGRPGLDPRKRATAATAATTSAAVGGEVHGSRLPAHAVTRTSRVTAAARTRAPATSKGARRCRPRRGRQQHQGGHDGDHAHRQVDPEGPAPPDRVRQPAADDRPADRRDSEHGVDGGQIGQPLPGGDHVGDDGLDQDQQAAAAQALDRPGRDQGRHAGGQAADHRSDQEDRHRRDEDRPSAEPVAEHPVDGHHHRAGEHVRGVHPEQGAQPTELAGHGRQGRREDELVESPEQQAERQARHHQEPARHPRTLARAPPAHRSARGRVTRPAAAILESRKGSIPSRRRRHHGSFELWPGRVGRPRRPGWPGRWKRPPRPQSFVRTSSRKGPHHGRPPLRLDHHRRCDGLDPGVRHLHHRPPPARALHARGRHRDRHLSSGWPSSSASAVWAVSGPQYAGEFFAGWLTEYSLSIDNLFIFLIIMSSLKVPRQLQQFALMVGIVLALIFRGIFIAVGAAAINAFSWVFFIFGAFLMVHRGQAGHRLPPARRRRGGAGQPGAALRPAPVPVHRRVPRHQADGEAENGKRLHHPDADRDHRARQHRPAVRPGLHPRDLRADPGAVPGLHRQRVRPDGPAPAVLPARRAAAQAGLPVARPVGHPGLHRRQAGLPRDARVPPGGDWAPFGREIPIWLSLTVIIVTLAITTVASLVKSRYDADNAPPPAERGSRSQCPSPARAGAEAEPNSEPLR